MSDLLQAGEEVWEGAGCSVREPSADKEVPVSKGSEGCSIANPTEDLLPTSTKQEDHTGHTSEEGVQRKHSHQTFACSLLPKTSIFEHPRRLLVNQLCAH